MHDKILAGTKTFGQLYVLRNTGNGIVFSSERPGRNLVHDSILSENLVLTIFDFINFTMLLSPQSRN